ncbi:MAG TPA: xanthine dehydrogenase family protein molybdopterin-binding subunit [Geminicoccaceae bacterium]|nr:xanthine dehydrogenase family protein molybdopterin-binding subunit [Geminicoccaceae bacterium]
MSRGGFIMAKFGVGQPVRRVEDQRFITGAGRYTDDIDLDGQAYIAVVRSPEAHARITSIEVEAAKAAPGVLAVVTGAEYAATGGNALPCGIPMENRDGSKGKNRLRPVLCTERVRHVGDNVAFVVAETPSQAKDAAELVAVDYQSLDVVADTETAAEPGRPLVHDDVPNNLSFDWEYGDRAAVDAAFAKAAHITRLRVVNNRLVANAIEPRAAIADFDAAAGTITLRTCTQGGWLLTDILAGTLKIDSSKVRILTPDVGGGFGMKAFFYPEYAMAAWASRLLGRPVKWTGERSETFLADVMGRDHVTEAELALDADHRILGMKVETTANMGAYSSLFGPFIPTGAALKVLPGVYDVKHLVYRVKGVLTNTTPVDAYRGAGRPESIYLMERLMDAAAREVGEDRAEFRRKNFIPPSAMPFKTAAGEIYDSGDFARVTDTALKEADWGGLARRQAEAAARGLRRGIGMSYYIESTMGDPQEAAKITFEEDGTVSVAVGTQSNGQGHETAYMQLVNDRLGIPFDQIRIIQGDTAKLKWGGGTGGSRSLTAEGMAIRDASDLVIERGKMFASLEFEAAVADIDFERSDGTFRVKGTDRAIGILELARNVRGKAPSLDAAPHGLDAEAMAKIDAWTFPNGCHVAEVEIDPDTGTTRIVNYVAVDDFGVVLNPLLVAGQVHGGVVQGLGQALMEHAVYDDGGQLLTGSFMDYAMPHAADMPSFRVSTVEVPCKNNPLGVKGCGEAGSVASPAAVINAIIDALADLGVRHIDMPASPQRVWQAIQEHQRPIAAE